MKEAIANAGIFNLVITFVIILLAFFIGSLGYSKAFKVKNRIIEEIEKDHDYSDNTQSRIEEWLGTIGYRVKSNFNSRTCGTEYYRGKKGRLVNRGGNYEYCVYKFYTCLHSRCSTHYRAVSFMYFDVPVISQLIKIPIKGETISFSQIKS